MASNLQIPPNGFQGAAHQSAAVRNHIAAHMSKAPKSSARRKRKAKAAKGARKPRRSKAAKGITILKAGSAAAKAWGAKMKRLRKKKTAA